MISASNLLTDELADTCVGIYIHIPFCVKKCLYCDFFSVPVDNKVPQEYINAIKTELGERKYMIFVKSIYFGGGCPSLLSYNQIKDLLQTLNDTFQISNKVEVTLEINPEDVNYEWLKYIKEIGINRVSVGVQSFVDKELEYLGRRHNSSRAKLVCEWVNEIFDNWGMDLIYGVKGATVENWIETLKTALSYNPPHISTYCLTIEEDAPLWKLEKRHEIDEDQNLKLYKLTHKILTSEGYIHYEISNFSKKRKKCIHNLIYWKNEAYIGLGAGAYSFIPPLRCANPKNIDKYVDMPGVKSEVDYLDIDIIKKETLIQHFRLKSGISENYYLKRFGSSIWKDFGNQLERLRKRKLLSYNKGHIFPTMKGFYLNNEIGLELL